MSHAVAPRIRKLHTCVAILLTHAMDVSLETIHPPPTELVGTIIGTTRTRTPARSQTFRAQNTAGILPLRNTTEASQLINL